MSSDDEQIAEQLEFVQWLKDNQMYDEFKSAASMRFGHQIWLKTVKQNTLWEQFIVETMGPMGFKIKVCGLCGNSGEIDTTKNPPVAPYGKPITPIKTRCICPNGRS